jgi:hypothetical protein
MCVIKYGFVYELVASPNPSQGGEFHIAIANRAKKFSPLRSIEKVLYKKICVWMVNCPFAEAPFTIGCATPPTAAACV